jgi:hypothetical protein
MHPDVSYTICYSASLLHYGLIYGTIRQFCKEIDAARELYKTLCVCVYVNHVSTTCNTCETPCKYCGCRSAVCLLPFTVYCYIDCLESTHVQVGQAWAGRGTALRDCYIHGHQAGRHGHKAVDSLHQSFQNQHFADIYTESRQTFVWRFVCMLTIVTTGFFVSCFNICSDVLYGQHGHGAFSDYGWRIRPVDMEGSCVCVEYTDANNRQGVFSDSVFKKLRE